LLNFDKLKIYLIISSKFPKLKMNFFEKFLSEEFPESADGVIVRISSSLIMLNLMLNYKYRLKKR